MTRRKIPLFAAAVCAASLMGAPAASAQQTVVGGGVVYVTDVEGFDLGFQVNGYLAIAAVPGLRVGGDFTYYLPHKETFGSESITVNLMAFNGNAHYFFMSTPEMGLYGLGGLSLARISASFMGQSESDTEMGLNLGIGAEFHLGFGALYGEAKMVTGDADRIVVGGGIRIPIM
jgi:hypothetical protein